MAGIIQLDDRQEWCADSWIWEIVVGCLRELVDFPTVRLKIDDALDTGIYWFSLQEISPAEAVLVRGAILTQLRGRVYVRLRPETPDREQVLRSVESLIRSAGLVD